MIIKPRIRISIYNAIIIHFVLLAFCLPLIIWGLMPWNTSPFLVQSLEISNCVVFTVVFFSNFMIGKRLYHPYVLFLIGVFSFVVSRVFFDVFSSNPVYDLSSHFMMGGAFSMDFSLSTQIKLQLIILLSIWFGHLGALVAFNNTRKNQNREWIYDQKWGKIGLFLFWLFLIPAFIYYAEQVAYLFQVGYKEFLQPKESIFSSSSILFRLSDDFFQLGFVIFLASKPTYKKILVPLLIFIAILLFRSVLGARVVIFTQVLMIISYLGYRNFIRMRHVIFTGIVLLTISSLVATYRSYSYYGVTEKFKAEEAVPTSFIGDFFVAQSATCGAMAGALQKEEDKEITKQVFSFFYPLFTPLLSPVISLFGVDPLLMYELNNKYSLAYKLSIAILGEKKVAEGAGLGSSYMLEFYFAFGFIGVALGCFYLLYLVLFWIEKGINKTLNCYFTLYALPSFFYMGRSDVMDIFANLWLPAFFLLVIVFVVKIKELKKKNIKK